MRECLILQKTFQTRLRRLIPLRFAQSNLSFLNIGTMTAFPQSSGIFSVSQIFLHYLWITSIPISPVDFISSVEIPSKPAALPSLRCFKALHFFFQYVRFYFICLSAGYGFDYGSVWWSRNIIQVSIVFFPPVLDLFLFSGYISIFILDTLHAEGLFLC